MPRIKSNKLFPTFSQVNKPDFERLSQLTKAAMGNRSAISFAKDCRLSQPTILRILNVQLKTPIADEIIDAIAKNACENSNVTLAALLEANGLVELIPNESYDDIIVKDMVTSARPEYAKKFEIAGKKLIEKIFQKQKITYSVADSDDFNSIPYFAFDVEYKTDALLEHKIANWCFNFIYYTSNDNKETFYNKLSKVFATAFLFPNAMENRAITIVTNYTDVYEDMLYDFCSAEVPIPISLVFADVISGKIYEEYQLPTNKNINIEIFK